MLLDKLGVEVVVHISEFINPNHRCIFCEEHAGVPTKVPEAPWWQFVCIQCWMFFDNGGPSDHDEPIGSHSSCEAVVGCTSEVTLMWLGAPSS